MTDTERERINAICEVAGVAEIDDLSDGFHTFRQLYYQRMMLFATIVKQNKDKAWKSLRHEDGELCFGGEWFIVGIDTPKGSYTYHYENKYWDMFDCIDLPRAKHWDGHTEADAETRLMSLKPEPHWIPVTERLPETTDAVLTTYIVNGDRSRKYVEESSYYGNDESWSSPWDEYRVAGTRIEVIAWMPLPESYKGVTE